MALQKKCEALQIRTEIADAALARISQKENCYAAVVFDKYERELLKERPHMVLHQPSDMGNVGSILRTCLGFGMLDIGIICPAADIFHPRVVRASMGAMFSLRIRTYDSFDAYRADNPERMLYPFMLDGATALQALAPDIEKPYTLIFGNEATGLPASFAEMGQPVRIAHSAQIDSLNLAVAVSIAAYQFSVYAEGPQIGEK